MPFRPARYTSRRFFVITACREHRSRVRQPSKASFSVSPPTHPSVHPLPPYTPLRPWEVNGLRRKLMGAVHARMKYTRIVDSSFFARRFIRAPRLCLSSLPIPGMRAHPSYFPSHPPSHPPPSNGNRPARFFSRTFATCTVFHLQPHPPLPRSPPSSPR